MANTSAFENVDFHINKGQYDMVIKLGINSEDRILITEKTTEYFQLINAGTLGQCVTVLGVIVNILNVIIFLRQGIKDSFNLSLLGLTISDMGSLVFLFLVNLCWTPSITKLDLPFYPNQIGYFFVFGHILFSRVTTGTTAWITLERCLCIVAPLKIKSVVTPRRTAMFICMLYVVMAAAISPTFYVVRFTWMFDFTRNKSVLGISKIADRALIENTTFWINNILPTVFFITIVIGTAVLIKTLRKQAEWRQQSTSLTKTNRSSNRDTKTAKMVLFVSIVFILSYAPGAMVFLAVIVFPEINYAGRQKNVIISIYSCLLLLESINASSNFFIYLKMSSKFKQTFLELFQVDKKEHPREAKKKQNSH